MAVEATRPGGTISNIGYHGHGDNVAIPARAGAWAWETKPSVRVFVLAVASAWRA
jgi:threonine dehydrogenase-like Zn-dependent dehydrogenase